MSTLSKIFVVINLLLAVAFAIFTVTLYSKRTHYYDLKVKMERVLKAEIATRDQQITDLNQQVAKITEEKKNAEQKRDEHKNSAETLRTQLKQSEVKLLDALNTVKLTTDQKAVLIKQVEAMRQELESTRKVVVKLKGRETVLKTNNDELTKQCADFKNKVNESRLQIAVLHNDRRRIAEELANAEFVLRKLNEAGIDVQKVAGGAPFGPVPDVRTKVVAIKRTTGHVALGAGSKSGIKEGFEFLIHRGDKYIGKVRVTTVWDDFSGGTIIERKEPIKEGDDAMTDRRG